jgi:hypothetical protein
VDAALLQFSAEDLGEIVRALVAGAGSGLTEPAAVSQMCEYHKARK